jgi:hypothetical protein
VCACVVKPHFRPSVHVVIHSSTRRSHSVPSASREHRPALLHDSIKPLADGSEQQNLRKGSMFLIFLYRVAIWVAHVHAIQTKARSMQASSPARLSAWGVLRKKMKNELKNGLTKSL